jgi:hypothetical protein
MEQFDFPKFADLLDKEGRPAKKRQKWKMFWAEIVYMVIDRMKIYLKTSLITIWQYWHSNSDFLVWYFPLNLQ